MTRNARVIAAAAVLLVAACAGDNSSSDVLAPQYAKPAGPTDPVTSWLIPLDATGLAFTSDGAFAAGGYSVYQSGTCGVSSKIFATAGASNSGDAIMQTDNPKTADRKCSSYPRKVTFTYPDGSSETTTLFANLHEVQNTSYSIPVGTTVTRKLNLSSSTSASRCGVIKFRGIDNEGNVLGADEVLVTRVDASTWDVATQPPPLDRGYCVNTGELLAMPVSFRIVSATPLP
jgi:hypothetical protein